MNDSPEHQLHDLIAIAHRAGADAAAAREHRSVPADEARLQLFDPTELTAVDLEQTARYANSNTSLTSAAAPCSRSGQPAS
jgi:hypothetical protein